MRKSCLLLAAVLLSACGDGTSGNTEATGDTLPPPDTTAMPVAPVDWPGYYDGTFPLGKGREVAVQVWVRSDSVFIIRQRTKPDDSLAHGAIGTWRVVQVEGGPAEGLLEMEHDGDPPDHYQRTAKGLVFVDVINGVDIADTWQLEKLADEIQDEVPRMVVKGTFIDMADAMSFRPCGSKYSWPCAGGLDAGGEEEGEVLNSMSTVDLEKAYGKAVAKGGDPWTIEVEGSLGMGPAMEGDGVDEYLFIHRVRKGGVTCP